MIIKNINNLSTEEQYYSLSQEELLRMIYAGLLHQVQESAQIKEVVFTILELEAVKSSEKEKQLLLSTSFDSNPILAVHRQIEEVKKELENDLREGIYNMGL